MTQVNIQNRIYAIYGLGAETERFLTENAGETRPVGLLDGFRESGTMYDCPIISMLQAIEAKVELILVIARPGSCKAIAKRIGDICKVHGIELIDNRGNDLLEKRKVSYAFHDMDHRPKAELIEAVKRADVVSFDLFDTLITRKTPSYTDMFELLGLRLKACGIDIADFASLRLQVEKEISKKVSPTLVEIYKELLQKAGHEDVDPGRLADEEFALDSSLLLRRDKLCDLMSEAHKNGKTVIITTDTYYSGEQIRKLLKELNITDHDDLFVSCEYGIFKPQGLFRYVSEKYKGKKILHVGNDAFSDGESAGRYGIESFIVYSVWDMYYALGNLGLERDSMTISDRVKIGLLASRLFNDPFCFEDNACRLSVLKTSEIGYFFIAPMIIDFALWLKTGLDSNGINTVLFGARDGYLLKQIFELIDDTRSCIYFYTSRTAAIRAGVKDEDDLKYVSAMKYSGNEKEAIKRRFGVDNKDEVLTAAKEKKDNYLKYIDTLDTGAGKTAFIDFVAKGTTQLFMEKVMERELFGFYFLQLEPESMAKYNLDVTSFYSDAERDSSSIFNLYYVLETVLTAPHPQVLEFDRNGEPVFAEETRTANDIKCVEEVQEGIIEYAREYLTIVPSGSRGINKQIDEAILDLITKVRIGNDEFLKLTVEDPFFNRMTGVTDILG